MTVTRLKPVSRIGKNAGKKTNSVKHNSLSSEYESYICSIGN